MATKFVKIPVTSSSISYTDRFIVQIKKEGYYQDGKCFTGHFIPSTNIFRIDCGVHFYLEEIKKLWRIDNTEFSKSINFSDSITSGTFQFISPSLRSTPMKYYIIKNPTYNGFLSLYMAIPVEVIKRVSAAGIRFEGYSVHTEWGKPFEDHYRCDLIVSVPIRDDRPRYVENLTDSCQKLMFYASDCFMKVDGCLQLLDKVIQSTHVVDGNLMVGTILDGRGYFSVAPHRLSPQCGRSIELYLPIESDGFLSRDIRNPNLKILGQPLDKNWGDLAQFKYNGFTSPDLRVTKATYYHKADVIDNEVLKFIQNLTKEIQEYRIESTVTIAKNVLPFWFNCDNFCGMFLDGRCYFEAIPIQIKAGVVDHYAIHQRGVSCNNQKTWTLNLYLPVGQDKYLVKDIRQSNLLLGKELSQVWGDVVSSYHGRSTDCLNFKIWRRGDAIFYHDPKTVEEGLVDFLYDIERQLRKCPGAEKSIGGYRSIIHLEDL